MTGWKVAAFTLAVALFALWYADNLTGRLADTQMQLQDAHRAVDTLKRAGNADIGTGNVDADTEWLCKRAGRTNCGP